MIGSRLKELRLDKRKTIEEIAKFLGTGRSTYAGYEAEYRQPPNEILVSLAEYHNVSTDYLLGVTDIPDAKDPETNAKVILGSGALHWDGIPLNDEELKPIRELLELVVRERLPKKQEETNKTPNN